MNFDDLKKDVEYEVPGWGILTVVGFSVRNKVSYYDQYMFSHEYESGADAEYICLDIDILNTQTKDHYFLDDITVTAVYDEDYVYSGWAKQYNYDLLYHPEYFLDSSENWFAIAPMYQGHYIVACTLPNAVVNGSKPLSLTLTIDGNEFTYIVRK